MRREKKEGEGGMHSYLVSREREKERDRGGEEIRREEEQRNRDGDTPTPRIAISRIMMTVSSLMVVERT